LFSTRELTREWRARVFAPILPFLTTTWDMALFFLLFSFFFFLPQGQARGDLGQPPVDGDPLFVETAEAEAECSHGLEGATANATKLFVPTHVPRFARGTFHLFFPHARKCGQTQDLTGQRSSTLLQPPCGSAPSKRFVGVIKCTRASGSWLTGQVDRILVESYFFLIH